MNNYPFVNYNNEKKVELFNSYNGFIRGNMFKNLYEPYLASEPFEINIYDEKTEMKTYIDALGFALNDLNIYLDIYSDDANTINLFNKIRKEKETVTNEYEKKYGPLCLDSDSLESYPWAWDNMPWPWNNR